MRNVSDKSCRENRNTFLPLLTFFENRPVYEIILKNIVETDRPQMTIWRMRMHAGWLRLETRSEYVVLTAFLWQQWLREPDSLLRYTYIACLVLKKFVILMYSIFGIWPPLWSSGQSFWLQIQRSWVRFPALPDFLSSSGSGTGSTQPREVNWGATWISK